MATNRRWLLARHPGGAVDPSCFTYDERPAPGGEPGGGKVLIEHELLLCAPTIRNWISGNRTSYYPTVEPGTPVMAPAVGRIVKSDEPQWPTGARLVGIGTWQDRAWIEPGKDGYRLVPEGVASTDALGILGMNALTAYFGLLEIGRPAPEEVLLVSGAAGSVGSLAAQIGRIIGCRVVALCGGPAKTAWLREECGIEDVIDYKAEDVGARLDELCPKGIDVFFDNVGGQLLADTIGRMRMHGRIVLCGQIATYDTGQANPSLDMMRIIYGRMRLQGFIVSDYAAFLEDAMAALKAWDEAGLIAHRTDIRDGFSRLPETFAALFDGSNTGTLIARIADGEGRPL